MITLTIGLDKIIQESYKFKNVATCFGKTHLRDAEGRELYLNCLDIDSQMFMIYCLICESKMVRHIL
jgi:hypothetical protein